MLTCWALNSRLSCYLARGRGRGDKCNGTDEKYFTGYSGIVDNRNIHGLPEGLGDGWKLIFKPLAIALDGITFVPLNSM
jgi:hypothetical protein